MTDIGSETESEENSEVENIPENNNYHPLNRPILAEFKPVKTDEYCICKSTMTTSEFTVSCQSCHSWFHGKCVKVTPSMLTRNPEFTCSRCRLLALASLKPLKPIQTVKPKKTCVVNLANVPILMEPVPKLNRSKAVTKPKAVEPIKSKNVSDGNWRIEYRPATPIPPMIRKNVLVPIPKPIIQRPVKLNTNTKPLQYPIVKPVPNSVPKPILKPVMKPIHMFNQPIQVPMNSNYLQSQSAPTQTKQKAQSKQKLVSNPVLKNPISKPLPKKLPEVIKPKKHQRSSSTSKAKRPVLIDSESSDAELSVIEYFSTDSDSSADLPENISSRKCEEETLSDILDGISVSSEEIYSDLDDVEVYELNDILDQVDYREISADNQVDEDELIERAMDEHTSIYQHWSSSEELDFSEDEQNYDKGSDDDALEQLLSDVSEDLGEPVICSELFKNIKSEILIIDDPASLVGKKRMHVESSPVLSYGTESLNSSSEDFDAPGSINHTEIEDTKIEAAIQSFDIKKTHVEKDGKLITTTKSVTFQIQPRIPKKSSAKERRYTHDSTNYQQLLRNHSYSYQSNAEQRQDFDLLIQNMAQCPHQIKSYNGKLLVSQPIEKQSSIASKPILTKSDFKIQRSKAASQLQTGNRNRKRKRDLEAIISIDEFIQLDSDDEEVTSTQQRSEPFLERFQKIPINAFKRFRKQAPHGNLRKDYSRLEIRNSISNLQDRSLSHLSILNQPFIRDDIFLSDI